MTDERKTQLSRLPQVTTVLGQPEVQALTAALGCGAGSARRAGGPATAAASITD